MSKLLCWLFGHPRPKRGWWGDGLYGSVYIGPVDGIGRTHFTVFKNCERCGQTVNLARFHGSERLITAMQRGQHD